MRVPGCEQKAEEAYGCAYRRLRQKAVAPGYGIGDVFFLQTIFQNVCLAVGAIQDCNIGKAAGLDAFITCDSARVQHIHTANHTVDLFCNEDPFRKGTGRLRQTHRRSAAAVGQQTARAAGIVPDDRQRAAKHLGRGAIILGKANDTQPGDIFCQAVEACCIRAAKAINRLVRVSDGKKTFAAFCPCPHKTVLQRVNVLKLIHQKISKTLRYLFRELTRFKKRQRFQEQVIKIQHIQLAAAGDIRFTERGIHIFRHRQSVFLPGNSLHQLCRRQLCPGLTEHVGGNGLCILL